MEILNIDSLATPATKKVAIAGKEYEVVEMSVQQFIDYSKKSKVLDDNPDAAEYEKVENMAEMITDMIPECPKEVLLGLQFNQINAIFAFCRGVLAEEIMNIYGQAKSEESTETKKGEQKKARRPSR